MKTIACLDCGAPLGEPHAPQCPDARTPWTVPTMAQAHRARTDLAAVQLTNQLRRSADAGCASPNDLQLLAALDRWAAGELV